MSAQKEILLGNVSAEATYYQPSPRTHLAVTGIMLVIVLFAIDATIVSTSMPTIVAKLGGLELYSWVFSIYMLTSALTTPIFGKLADLFSRRVLMLTGIGIFVAGSTLCGAAQSMEMMVLFRAVQGLGGGAIYALAYIIVGVLYPPERRASMQGLISSIWGISSILGPLAGGIIVEHWSWRWIFFVNLPITAVASVLIVLGLKEPERIAQSPKLDWPGALMLLILLALVFYALSANAHMEQPLNVPLMVILTLAGFVLIMFLMIEHHAQEPIIPLDLFRLRLFRACAGTATFASMGVFGAVSYLPLYLQGVLGVAASRAGLVVMLLSLGWTGGSLLAARWINRYGYRFAAVLGMILITVGYGLLLVHESASSMIRVVISAVTIGSGMGLTILTSLVAAQGAVWINRIGVATSTIMLFRTFAGAFAASLMGTVLLNRMRYGLEQLGNTISPVLRDKVANPQNLLEPATRALVPPDILPKLVATLGDALWYAFFAMAIFMLAGIFMSFSMGHFTPANTPRPK